MTSLTVQSVIEVINKGNEVPYADFTAIFKQHYQEIIQTQRNVNELIDGFIGMMDTFQIITKNLDNYQDEVIELKENMVEFLQNNVKEVTAKIDIMMPNNIEKFEENIDTTLMPNNSFEDLIVESEIEAFGSIHVFNLHPFKSIELTNDMKKFPCKIVDIIGALHIIVEPIIDEFNYNFHKMEKKIKRYGNQLDCIDPTINRVCVARYSEDSCYYRSLIIDHNYSKNEVKVLFVDYLTTEVVKHEHIKQYPHEFLQTPLKHLVVRLHGIQPNPDVSQSEIKLYLNEYIEKEAIAVIVQNNVIPSVHLYNKCNQNVLLYQSLIGLNIYKKHPDQDPDTF